MANEIEHTVNVDDSGEAVCTCGGSGAPPYDKRCRHITDWIADGEEDAEREIEPALDIDTARAANSKTRRDLIALTIDDLVLDLFDEGRTDDEELPRGSIEEAIEAGEVTIEDLVSVFRRGIEEYLAS